MLAFVVWQVNGCISRVVFVNPALLRCYLCIDFNLCLYNKANLFAYDISMEFVFLLDLNNIDITLYIKPTVPAYLKRLNYTII